MRVVRSATVVARPGGRRLLTVLGAVAMATLQVGAARETAGAQPARTAEVVVRAPDAAMEPGGDGYVVPIAVRKADPLSTISVVLELDRDRLRPRSVQEGTFMRQAGAWVTFESAIDADAGRVELTATRVDDRDGAAGAGLLAIVVVDALGAGEAAVIARGSAVAPDGSPVELSFTVAPLAVR